MTAVRKVESLHSQNKLVKIALIISMGHHLNED